MAGNVSDISKNIARIVVDNTDPTFDLQPTEINADVNTPITTTIATVPLKVVTAISSTLILLSLPIPLQTIEVDKLVSFTDIVISCSALLPASFLVMVAVLRTQVR
jgi:hypothetical protein